MSLLVFMLRIFNFGKFLKSSSVEAISFSDKFNSSTLVRWHKPLHEVNLFLDKFMMTILEWPLKLAAVAI